MSVKVLNIKEWLELKTLEDLKSKLLAASERIKFVRTPYFNGTWAAKHLLGLSDDELSNLIKKKS